MTNAASNSQKDGKGAERSPITTVINVLAAPTEAIRTLKGKPTVLFPLAVIVLATIAIQAWYFSILDMAWFADDIIASFGDNFTDEQAENIRELYTQRSRIIMMASGGIGGAVALVVMYVLHAGYLTLASALGGDEFRFKHWFSLICWTSLPYLLSVVGMAVTILLSANGQLSAFELDPLSLANLGMAADNNGALQTLYSAVTLTMIWSLALVVLGYKQWLNASWLKSFLVVTAPYILIFGVWLIIAINNAGADGGASDAILRL